MQEKLRIYEKTIGSRKFETEILRRRKEVPKSTKKGTQSLLHIVNQHVNS